jgi:hypothetical protein
MSQRRLLWQAFLTAFVLSVGLGVALEPRALAQSPGSPPPSTPKDLKSPQPERDASGRIIPNHFTLTICKGTFFDMTPKNGGRDRYQTPHGVRNIKGTSSAATGSEQGENGTIRINSGPPGVPATTGESTIDYDITDNSTGQVVEHVTVKVKVIDCTPKKNTAVKKAVIGAGAVAAGVAVAVAGGGSTPPKTPVAAAPTTTTAPTTSTTSVATSTTSVATTSAASTTTTSIAQVDVSGTYGTFNITATKTMDTGCNFQPSFTGQIQLSGNSTGSAATVRMLERLVREYRGAMQASGSFTADGSGNLDGFAYTGQIMGQVAGTTITGSETMNFSSGCPGRMVIYTFTGAR